MSHTPMSRSIPQYTALFLYNQPTSTSFQFPEAGIYVQAFNALKCDANYLHQDELNAVDYCPERLRYEEMKHIGEVPPSR